MQELKTKVFEFFLRILSTNISPYACYLVSTMELDVVLLVVCSKGYNFLRQFFICLFISFSGE